MDALRRLTATPMPEPVSARIPIDRGWFIDSPNPDMTLARPHSLVMQLVLEGRCEARFGHRVAHMDARHLRVGMGALDSLNESDQASLRLRTVVIHPPTGLQPEFMEYRSIRETLSRIRFDAGRAGHVIRRLAWNRCTRLQHPDHPQWVESVMAALSEAVSRTLHRIDRLPGRSLYKRADLFMRLEAARDTIESEFHRDPGTPDLAEISHISRAHFIRLFSAFYGISPKQMTLQYKLDEARRLLRETNDTVMEVALRSGFGNRCAFQRLFRSRTGFTPMQYRCAHREECEEETWQTKLRSPGMVPIGDSIRP